MKLVYTWQGDQVKTRDMCVLSTTASTPRREVYYPLNWNAGGSPVKKGYDQMMRLGHVEMPNRGTNGGPFDVREFGCNMFDSTCNNIGYDGRGNRRTPEWLGTGRMAYNYAVEAYLPDRLGSYVYSDPWSKVQYTFLYDGDGRTTSKTWASDSIGPSHSLTFSYGFDPSHAALESVFKAVTVADGRASSQVFFYFYDALGRRWKKEYPAASATDEFFYDTGHVMLEDRGVNSATSPTAYPEDDYVWLGGRPVAYVRGQFNTSWARQSDATANCSRLGDNLPCGIYFVITDHIGKPVMTLNASRQISGVYDYDPGGFMNRYAKQNDTPHPYPNCSGTSQYCTSNTNQVTEFSQRRGATGLTVKMRARFHLVDTESCEPSIWDRAQIKDGDTGACLVDNVGGQHKGAVVTNWFTPSNGYAKVMFYSDSLNYCPDGNGCASWCSNPSCPGGSCSACCSSCGTGCGKTEFCYSGVITEAAEYQQFATGATPLTMPLRFPGQYYDQETDLHENWHRYYDPAIGRYLQPDPVFGSGSPYPYAANNPVSFADPAGLRPRVECGDISVNCGWQDPMAEFLDMIMVWLGATNFANGSFWAGFASPALAAAGGGLPAFDLSGQMAQLMNTMFAVDVAFWGRYFAETGVSTPYDSAWRPSGTAWYLASEYGTTDARLTSDMTAIEDDVNGVYRALTGKDATVTFTTNGKHMVGSLHYSGNAIDLRVLGMTELQMRMAIDALRRWLGPKYDVVLERKDPHIHIEYDPRH